MRLRRRIQMSGRGGRRGFLLIIEGMPRIRFMCCLKRSHLSLAAVFFVMMAGLKLAAAENRILQHTNPESTAAPEPARIERDAKPAAEKLSQSEELTLRAAYERALTQSESLQRSQEDIHAAEARYQQALAALFPKIHLITTQRLRDDEYRPAGSRNNDGTGNGEVPGGATSDNRFNASKNQLTTQLTVQQLLFSGFRDSYLSDAAESDVQALRLDKQRKSELLYLDVVDLFNQIRLYEGALNIIGRSEKVLNERLGELGRFIELGRSRDSELLPAQSELAELGVVRAQAVGALGASREMLAFLVGVPAEQLKIKFEHQAALAQPLDLYLARIESRADLKAAEARAIAARQQLKATERLAWPELSLEGNVYPYEDPDNQRNAELLLRFDVPLYQGGLISAQTEERRAREHASRLTVQEIRRAAERDVRTAFNDYSALRAETERVQTLVKAARTNYQRQRKDYELGVVTNLDVLQAIRALHDAERRLIDSEVRGHVSVARLEVAAGGAP